MPKCGASPAAFSLVPVIACACAPRPETGAASTQASPAPLRIVTIAPNAAEIIAALGEDHRLVGVSQFCIYPPELSKLPRVGGLFDPDLETILGLEPDLLVIRGRIPEVEQLCKTVGIRLHHDPTERFEDIYGAIRQLGAILEKPVAADRLIAGIRDRVSRVARGVEGRARPRVFLAAARQPDSIARLSTAGGDTFVDEIITLAGGKNVFGDLEIAYPDVSLESVLAARPDVIIEAMPEIELTETLHQQIMGQWRRLDTIPAVRNGRVHVVTDDHLLIPSPRVAESIERMARLLHPEVRFD